MLYFRLKPIKSFAILLVSYSRKLRNQLPIYIVLLIALSLSFISAAKCDAAKFKKLSVDFSNGQLTLVASFDTTISYKVRAENNGRSLILLVPNTTYSKEITEQTIIPPNNVLSGWSIRNTSGSLVVKFKLTGYYSYSHTYSEPNIVQIEIYGAKKTRQIFNTPTNISNKPSNGLTKGIKLYNNRHYDEALNEFKAEVSKNVRCPLIYYYAAHIRLKKKQYKRAQDNLLAALRDSSNFSDARGLLAYTRMKLGNENDAFADWRMFIMTAGTLKEDEPITVDSIMLPEEYHHLLEQKQEERLKAEKTEKARADSIAATQAQKPSVTTTDKVLFDTKSTADDVIEAEETAKDLEERNRKNIRYGIYGLITAGVLLLTMFGAVIWIRKRLRVKADLSFNAEVKRLLEEKSESTELLDHDEEQAIDEYQAISREIAKVEISPEKSEHKKEETINTTDIPFKEEHKTPIESIPRFENRSETITEEVKALVTRMYKEGHSTADIARAADLTQTEVDLIVAVRARHMEQLIQEVTGEEEDFMDTDQLYQAIAELNSEGGSTREIARKLSISTSEVQLALSLMKIRKNHQVR